MLLRKKHFAVLLFLFVLVLSACGGDEATPATDNQPSGTSNPPAATLDNVTAEPTANPVVAMVNDELITVATYEGELRREEARYEEIGLIPADRAAFDASVLDRMIDQLLIEQAAQVQGLTVTDEELEAELTLLVEVAGGQEAWENWLAENLYTEEEYRVGVRSTLLTNKIRDQVVANVPDAIEQVHARHILVGSRAEADAIYQQLLNSVEFGELAALHSLDVSTRDMGGDLGWFAQELGQLTVQEVTDAAFSLQPGEFSEPVASRLGHHIVQTLERIPDRPLDDSARAAFFEITFDRWRQSLWSQATVEILIDR